MRGLIINHNTQYLDKLVELFNCDVMNHIDFNVEKVEQYDYIILSGGPIDISKETDIVAEKDWLRETNKPILGICLGLQILCLVYDETLEYKELEHTRKLYENIQFENVDYDMFYNHSYYFSKVPEGFDGKVRNNILIYMKHRQKPIIAFQGHPEMSEHGEEIRDYFLSMI
jgi:anthranilate/para-aminobenzoate synthase component II